MQQTEKKTVVVAILFYAEWLTDKQTDRKDKLTQLTPGYSFILFFPFSFFSFSLSNSLSPSHPSLFLLSLTAFVRFSPCFLSLQLPPNRRYPATTSSLTAPLLLTHPPR